MSQDPAYSYDQPPQSYQEEAESGVRIRPAPCAQDVPESAPGAEAGRPQARPAQPPPAAPAQPHDGMAVLGQQILAQVYHDFVVPRQSQPPRPPGELESFGQALFDKVQQDFGSTPPPAPATSDSPAASVANDVPAATPEPRFDEQPTVPYEAHGLLEPPAWAEDEPGGGDADAFATPLQRTLRKLMAPFRRTR